MSGRPEHIDRNAILRVAMRLGVICGGCGHWARPYRVSGAVVMPQHDGVSPYAIVEYRCDAPDCDTPIYLEVDLP